MPAEREPVTTNDPPDVLPSESLARARALTRLLDSAVGIPGTRFRFGLDPVLGLVPGLGDFAGLALSGYIITIAARAGAPPAVIARLVGNVALDAAVGTIPLLGDLFDFGWRANTRNLILVERYLVLPGDTHRSSVVVVGAALTALAGLAAGSVYLAIAIVRVIAAALG